MSTATDTSTDRAVALPRTGRMNDPQAQGRLAALRTFTDALTTMDGINTYDDAVNTVITGRAPQAFKNAFLDTLRNLSALFDTDAQ